MHNQALDVVPDVLNDLGTTTCAYHTFRIGLHELACDRVLQKPLSCHAALQTVTGDLPHYIVTSELAF